MKIVMGIPSYLPDNKEVREYRFNRLKALINKCNQLFNLPIYIVTQNYREEKSYLTGYKNVILSEDYTPLGIVGARRKLREYFLNSDYDYLIMLDDDIIIYGSSGKSYLKQIEENPDCFIENNDLRIQLFAISKKIYSQIDFVDVSPEQGEAFEDRIFVESLRIKFPEARRIFKDTGLFEDSPATADIHSTWYKGQDIESMLANTEEIIAKIKNT